MEKGQYGGVAKQVRGVSQGNHSRSLQTPAYSLEGCAAQDHGKGCAGNSCGGGGEVNREEGPNIEGDSPNDTSQKCMPRIIQEVLALILSQKYLRRLTVLNNLVKLKTDNKEEDLSAWQWLRQLVKTLGDCGMSSEESDLENDIETVLRVKNMAWRRAIERELDIVDRQRLADDDIFAPQGSKPMKRVRAAGNPTSSRAQVDGLPKALYNEQWLMGLTKVQVEKLSISDKKFKWIQVAVA